MRKRLDDHAHARFGPLPRVDDELTGVACPRPVLRDGEDLLRLVVRLDLDVAPDERLSRGSNLLADASAVAESDLALVLMRLV